MKIVNKDELKDCDMVDVAYSLGIEVQRNGSTCVIRCPNHFGGRLDRNIGNCYIDKSRRYFHCRSCGNSGDVLTLIQQVQQCSFPEALKWLSEFSDIPIKYAEEGETYTDEFGETRTIRNIISREDQIFLGIENNIVEGISEILGEWEYERAKETRCEAVIDKECKVLYYVKKDMLTSNPLSLLASQNYEEYLRIVKERLMETYENVMFKYKLWQNTILENAIIEDTKKQIERLNKIVVQIGDGNMFEMPKNFLELSVNLAEVPF